jgi:flagellar protein FliS
MTSAAASRYLQDRVLTATPAELIGMIYGVAVRSLVAAGTSLAAGDRLAAGRHLVKAQDAVLELRCSLDRTSSDSGAAEMAGRMESLYEFVQLRLVRANVNGDAALVAECLEIVESLRQAWRQGCLKLASAPVGAPAVRS